MRSCSLCRTPDRPEIIPDQKCTCKGKGDILPNHTADCQKIEHYVLLVIKYQDSLLTARQAQQGWRQKATKFQGKNAIERFLCRPCKNRQAEINEMAAYQKKVLSGDRQEQTLYQILCS